MLERPFITLTTDYGLKDSFSGIMKGVILGINPNAKIIDITHNIERHNIYEASQIIGMSYKYFPPATIHIAVVDPGVGGERRPILVITENHYFIGPDNGIFTPIYEKEFNHFFKVLFFQILSKKTSCFNSFDGKPIAVSGSKNQILFIYSKTNTGQNRPSFIAGRGKGYFTNDFKKSFCRKRKNFFLRFR